jgi:ABC-type antimicrobial peptide transport system permease subunit
MLVAGAGIAIGIAAAGLLGRTITSLVFGVSVWDPPTYGLVAGVLTLVALVSCIAPALRASRVDPMVALRLE